MDECREPQDLFPLGAGHPMAQLAFQPLLNQVLDCLGAALIIVGAASEVIYTSTRADMILREGDGLSVSDGRLCLPDEADNIALGSAVREFFGAGALSGSSKKEVFARRPSGKIPYRLEMYALQQSDCNQPNGVAIVIRDMHANQVALFARLRSKFNLTLRECECALLVACCHNGHDVAASLGVTQHTLRQHLKNIYQKTKVHKQHELVGLVLSLYRKR